MKRFTVFAVSTFLVVFLIGVYVANTTTVSVNNNRVQEIEPAAGQQSNTDAVEESIKRIEKTMEEMEKNNNALKPGNQDKNNQVGDQGRAETREKPGIENLNAPREPAGDGVTEIIHAESMKRDNKDEASDQVQDIEPAAGDAEDMEDTVKETGEQALSGTSDEETEQESNQQQ